MATERDADLGRTGRDLDGRYDAPSGGKRWTERFDPMSFLVGGAAITGGLLTFLYYDGDVVGRRSLIHQDKALRFEAPASTVPNITTSRQPGHDRAPAAR